MGDLKGNLPRLLRHHYQGYAAVLWTLTMEGRARGWLGPTIHAQFRELLLHAAVREEVWCPSYCLMPDHIHLVWIGMTAESDQLNGMRFLRRQLNPFLEPCHFQHQAHDRVLREEDRQRGAFARVCFYVLSNPVRARLAGGIEDWPFSGALIPGYPDVHPAESHYWETFWKLHDEHR
jgi:REP element-mobilizing transposase RayT